MKIAFTGKGGVGKTTLAGIFIYSLSKEGREVLAVDCDPDSNLGRTLGFEGAEEIVPIAHMKDMIEERMGVAGGNRSIFKLNPKIDDIPDKFSINKGNIKLIVMGAVEEAGRGCMCPENTFVKNLLRHLVLRSGEHLVMDMEAGIEHLGRATADSVDCLIAVIEPSITSIETGKRIEKLAKGLGLITYFLANKLRGDTDRNFILARLKSDSFIGWLPYDEEINSIAQGKESILNLAKRGNEVVKAMDGILKRLQCEVFMALQTLHKRGDKRGHEKIRG